MNPTGGHDINVSLLTPIKFQSFTNMPNIAHERRICDLVAGLLLRWKNETLINPPYYPEDENPPLSEAIDAIYTTNAGKYIFEHTTIETYPSQITEDYKVKKLLDSLENKLSRRIAEKGSYHIMFATEVLKDHNICSELVDHLTEWVSQNANKLEIGSNRTAPRHMIKDMFSIRGKPLPVNMYRWPDNDISVKVVRSSPNDIFDKLLSQVKASLDRKIPKLIRWAKDNKAVPILVLETIDKALVHGTTIADAVSATIQSIIDQPEMIYIVQTNEGFCQVWEGKRPFGENSFKYLGLCETGCL
jgi:hypothetical protein